MAECVPAPANRERFTLAHKEAGWWLRGQRIDDKKDDERW